MDRKQGYRMLAEKIAGMCQEGFFLSDAVSHYIDSTFSNPSVEELEGIIADEFNCEREPLMELLFFPDEATQCKLEEILQANDFQTPDEQQVVNCFISRHPEAVLRFYDKRGVLKLPVTADTARQFVSRLKITKKLDKRVRLAIEKNASANLGKLCKVKLRNARFVQTEASTMFLCTFFTKLNTEGDDFLDCLEFVLKFLDELPEEKDLFQALIRKKRFYAENLQRAEKYAQQMKSANMENLLQQGLRIPHFDVAEAWKMIPLIDKISQAVFGKTASMLPLAQDVFLGEYRRTQDIKKVIKILS